MDKRAAVCNETVDLSYFQSLNRNSKLFENDTNQVGPSEQERAGHKDLQSCFSCPSFNAISMINTVEHLHFCIVF